MWCDAAQQNTIHLYTKAVYANQMWSMRHYIEESAKRQKETEEEWMKYRLNKNSHDNSTHLLIYWIVLTLKSNKCYFIQCEECKL